MLPWFLNNYLDFKVIQLYRNPFAVIASQMKHGFWNLKAEYNGYKLTGSEFNKDFYEQFKPIMARVHTPEEFLAVEWAIDVIPSIGLAPLIYLLQLMKSYC